MKLISHIALSLAAAGAPASVAFSADYDPPIYVEDTLEVPVEIGSGWYLRGDLGYAASTEIGQVTFRTFDPVSTTYGSGAFDSQELENNIVWGGGVGYSFNEWFRADATVDGFRPISRAGGRATFPASIRSSFRLSTAPAAAPKTVRKCRQSA